MQRFIFVGVVTIISVIISFSSFAVAVAQPQPQPTLWQVYQQSFKSAKYVDLTHAIAPNIPVWAGFGFAKFSATTNPQTGKVYTYSANGFEATHYDLPTDQLGTQLDPPAHWNPNYPTIDELPPTFAVRPLVVIPIQDKVAEDPNYHLQVEDILNWERKHGIIPEGSVVFVRSDWSKQWSNPELASSRKFPGVSLAALKFLHLKRKILFHGHEPLDTDSTPTLEGEDWLLNNGYTQAEGVANLDRVPETGALVAIGYAKFQGGLGGFARYIAICPPNWKYGVSVGELPESPLEKAAKPLHWDEKLGIRVR
ncbi:cyclase family protein [Oscillatoria salina]|uniref:cyclase family protein n=1 Tax=Oscillatoria salina TaxID=331517 RepID=UPI001CCEF614|nr:cyclase family protein [Oscillatoria salina]MBZ8183314.1 cyclase family protein [Oscillatoria salina IIICB1]